MPSDHPVVRRACHHMARQIHRPMVAAILVFVAAGVLVFAKSMAKEMNSDEHPFIATAVLWSRNGLLPYRDFHYNHLPTLLMIFGLLFKGTDHLLLAARGFNCVCAAAVVATLFYVAYQTFAPLGQRRRWLLSGAIALIVLTNPLFTLASGIAWNHDFPTLMTLWAFLAICRGTRNGGNAAWTAIAGLLIALAFTSRLTFGPAAAALALWLAFGAQQPWRRRGGLLAAFLAGTLIASLPTIWIVAQAPYNALWGNLLFPRLNTAYHADDGAGRITFFGKVGFLLLDLLQRPGNGLLMIVAITLAVQMFRRSADGVALIVVTGALWLGCFFPTPLFRQYMYAPMPLFVLMLVVAWQSAPDRRRGENWTLAVAALSFAFGCYHYVSVYRLPMPSQWSAIKIHNEGLAIRDGVGPGRILTFGPAIPMEGGLDIYNGLATGPYAYRVNAYLTDDDRRQLCLIDRDDLIAGFAANPPAAILTGFSKTLEVDLTSLAEANGFIPSRLRGGHVLWRPTGIVVKPKENVSPSLPLAEASGDGSRR